MLYNIPHAKGSGGKERIRFRHAVYEESPHIQSYAALVMLKEHYWLLDDDREFDDYRVRVQFSRRFLESQLALFGDLVCKYCGKSGLKIEYDFQRVPRKILATVDHVIPTSKGGKICDVNNVVVCCYKCNTLKGDKDLETFLQKMKH